MISNGPVRFFEEEDMVTCASLLARVSMADDPARLSDLADSVCLLSEMESTRKRRNERTRAGFKKNVLERPDATLGRTKKRRAVLRIRKA
jgi:hypothetical protein